MYAGSRRRGKVESDATSHVMISEIEKTVAGG